MAVKSTKKKPHYLVCVNSEEYSETALHFTCYLAKKNKGAIELLYVIEPADYQSIGIVAGKILREMEDEAQKLLNELAGKAKEWSGIIPVITLRSGLIEDEIISVIKENPEINMVIAGISHEHKSKIIPALVSAIGKKFAVPMMLVPGRLTEQEMEQLA